MTDEDYRRWHWFATTQPLTCASVDIDVDVDTAVCFLGARLPCTSVNALHCTWRVCTRTWAFKNSLLDPRSRAVEVTLVLDLETRTALSLHELFDLLCRTLKRFPRSAISTLSFGASRPQIRVQLSCKSFNRSDLTARCAYRDCSQQQSMQLVTCSRL